MDERFSGQLQFILEADKMKSIFRRNIVIDRSKYENDAEHSWHFALMAMVLYEYAPPGTDLLKVLKMALIHDLVEIYAGDTFAYDLQANREKKLREDNAADVLFSFLPEGQAEEYRLLWEEFDRAQTPDAVFAASIDRLQPFLLNLYTEGFTWKENGISAGQVQNRLSIIEQGMPALYEKVQDMLRSACEKGYLEGKKHEL